METAPLKTFATWARTALIREVTARVAAVLAPGSSERVEQAKAVAALEKAVAAAGGDDKGRAVVADKVAYTWFNRIVALRFMDAKGYTGIGVVSPQTGVEIGQPEILAEAKRGVIDTEVASQMTRTAVEGLLDGTRSSGDPQGEAYALLLADYCRYWNKAMPFMFEREGDYTELLIPANLLADDSVLSRSIKVLTEEVCEDVEVIGWLYQFYISERKDEVFVGFKKNMKAGAEEIPAATQLFTPHWIVRYLVENSLGRLWMLNHPSSRLVDHMDYYIAPVDEDADYLKITTPEELKVLDPACGSGHILTFAFDLLYAIYEEQGYGPTEIPGLILTHNLYGTEIDPRAGALAAFALAMKARARQRTFFNRQVRPNVHVLDPVFLTDEELAAIGATHQRGFWNQFADADTLGALTRPKSTDVAAAREVLDRNQADDLFSEDVRRRALTVIDCAETLSSSYAAVIANPPYMGWKNMNSLLSSWVKEHYLLGKQDLYAAFILRARELVRDGGVVAMITGDSWLTIKTFEDLRGEVLERCTVRSVLHLQDSSRHSDTFGANAAFILEERRALHRRARFVYLSPLSSEAKRARLLEALDDASLPWVYDVDADHFADVPGAPFAYRLSEQTRRAFREHPRLGEVATPLQGLATADDGRFLRRWWEVSRSRLETSATSREAAAESGSRWFPFTKGGEYRRWYGNNEYVVNWQYDGRELFDFRPRSVIRNPSTYFREAATWGLITAGAASFRYQPVGCVFGHKGPVIVADDSKTLRAVLALANSATAAHFLQILSPTLGYEVGHIANLPAPIPGEIDLEACDQLVALAKADWDSSELSWEFARPVVLQRGSLRALVSQVFLDGLARAQRAFDLEQANEKAVATALDLPLSARGEGLERISLFTNPLYGSDRGAPEREAESTYSRTVIEDLVSYAVGCMMGRFSPDLDGLILANQGDTLADYAARIPHPTFAPDADGVIPIVDGDWFDDDIVARFRQFLRAVFGDEHLEDNLRYIVEALGAKELRDYFLKRGARVATSRFYDNHVKRYKKRPIYWLFSSPGLLHG
ncbi:MAG TPA: BREX-1 system adenine-specific DNA-methyltransferase PglX [Aeromicrobium sp.]|nr:BREX-1 system adenine-specific DNA-methyltransferase PglX [Aeromicrobium sp.]